GFSKQWKKTKAGQQMHHQSANEEHDLKMEQDEAGYIYQAGRGDGKYLSHRYEQFLHCLVRGGSIKQAAAACNISYRTAIRWMKTLEFQEIYHEVSEGLATVERERTANAATLAMDVLVHILMREENISGYNEPSSTNVAIKA